MKAQMTANRERNLIQAIEVGLETYVVTLDQHITLPVSVSTY